MTARIYSQLSLMMFLQFFIWGAWFVTLGTYLAGIGFSGTQIGNAYLTNNIGAIVAPFLVGLIADRFFAAEKVMAILHITGAIVLYFVSDLTSASAIIAGLLLYNICYMPTLALVNTVSFNVMESPDTEFPRVRVWGTLGWICAGLSISFILSGMVEGVEASTYPMRMAAGASLLLGLFSFFLPHTPPSMTNEKPTLGKILGADALGMLKDRSFAIFALCSLLISIPLAFYYAFTNLYLNDLGVTDAAAKMSFGQMSEVAFMVLMPFFFRRLGVKWMLLVGMLAWAARYALFASGDADNLMWMIYGGILLHGVCYDFFFVTGQVYVDQKAPKANRASAQGFIALLTYGVGLAIGSTLAGMTVEAMTMDGARLWANIWWIPCVFAGVVAVLFSLLFREEKQIDEKAAAALTD
ncbi:nucleoside permease [Kordiimonas sp.]|uniref:nucleoside permease n=1 Tax=Kordiimonas sp. TaxID=1970157 RepID=UPI003A8FC542